MDEQCAKEAFSYYDPTLQGQIESRYLGNVMQALGYDLNKEQLEQLNQKLSVKQQISYKEFIKYIEQNPVGHIDEETLVQHFKNMSYKTPITAAGFKRYLTVIGHPLNSMEMDFIDKNILKDCEVGEKIDIRKLVQKLK
ncbi:calmodulin-like_protein [Hexamita inflata]|uniref:Calmodulin-like protein n=1 Tax=Hexamita inflata TaxID=28002 RepID=A0AA86VMG3_9EUKA|nr:calmodulin-like protein [Hexamita inflata]CAI9970828.1 calmodulin-like protein [Hexamita inflata]